MARPPIGLEGRVGQPHDREGDATGSSAGSLHVYLTPLELAARFRVSPRTLERWRCRKSGPNYHKLGGKISYALDDVEAYERRRRAETHSSILGKWE